MPYRPFGTKGKNWDTHEDYFREHESWFAGREMTPRLRLGWMLHCDVPRNEIIKSTENMERGERDEIMHALASGIARGFQGAVIKRKAGLPRI